MRELLNTNDKFNILGSLLDEDSSIQTNFTFRFPPESGHFYHIPTFSFLSDIEKSLWETQYRGGKINILLPTQLAIEFSRAADWSKATAKCHGMV